MTCEVCAENRIHADCVSSARKRARFALLFGEIRALNRESLFNRIEASSRESIELASKIIAANERSIIAQKETIDLQAEMIAGLEWQLRRLQDPHRLKGEKEH